MEWLKKFLEKLFGIRAIPTESNSPHIEVAIPAKPRFNLDVPIVGSRPWKGICWHHSASPDNVTRDWDGIVKYHTSYRIDFNTVTQEEFERRLQVHDGKVFQKPWKDVGYHGGTELVNGEPVFHWGRPLSMVGAHAGVAGVSNVFNEDFIGICCIGNYDAISPDPKLWEFNLALTRTFMNVFKIPKEQVIGHREVFDRLKIPRQKSCPGNSWNLEIFRLDL